MDVVILAAGFGNRMGTLTDDFPKQMLPIAGIPLLEWNIRFIKEELGLKNIIIITGFKEEIIQKYFGNGDNFGVNIKYKTQDLNKVKGLAVALSLVEGEVSENFVLMLGDNLYRGPFTKIIDEFNSHELDAIIHIEEVINPNRYGVVTMDVDQPNLVKALEEKPLNPKSNLVITGFYVLNYKIFNKIKRIEISSRGELELTDALNLLCQEGTVHAKLINGWRKDIGFKEDLLDASIWMLENLDDKNIKILSFIDETNMLIPPVFIGKNCTIKNSIIGPHSSIGNNVIIHNSSIKNSIILDSSKVIDENIEYNVILTEK